MNKFLLAVALCVAAGGAWAQDASTPVGLWKTIDDETGKPKSLVRIVEDHGELSGRVERLIAPDTPDPKCDKCTDDRKGQPVVGMTVIRHVRDQGDGLWGGGDILDPKNGKVYHVRLQLEDGGAKLKVRGYIGIPLLGRSQTWVRAE